MDSPVASASSASFKESYVLPAMSSDYPRGVPGVDSRVVDAITTLAADKEYSGAPAFITTLEKAAQVSTVAEGAFWLKQVRFQKFQFEE